MTDRSIENDAGLVEQIAEAMYDAVSQATSDQWLMWSHVAPEVRAYWLAQAEPYVIPRGAPS